MSTGVWDPNVARYRRPLFKTVEEVYIMRMVCYTTGRKLQVYNRETGVWMPSALDVSHPKIIADHPVEGLYRLEPLP